VNKTICLLGVFLGTVCGSCWAEELPDPTRPLTYSVKQDRAPKLVLQAILQRATGREAIVSGERVRVGSTVKGARIEEITDGAIVWSYRGERHALRLRPRINTRGNP
jgi:hypothetical protein